MNKIVVVLAVAAVVALAATDCESTHLGTYVHPGQCNPATNDLTRTTNGIRNTTTGNRSVYCGFEVRDRYSLRFTVLATTLRNHGSVERSVTCYWTSGQPHSGGFATATKTVSLPPGGLAHPNTFNLSRPNEFAALGLRCALPPDVALEYIELLAEDPTTT